MADGQWTKGLPKVDGDYYSRIDEFDKSPTPIRIERGKVYEFGCAADVRREHEAEEWEYFGPITPEGVEQPQLRNDTQAESIKDMFADLRVLREAAKAALRCLQGTGDKPIDQVRAQLQLALSPQDNKESK